jgi:hypothetical protein
MENHKQNVQELSNEDGWNVVVSRSQKRIENFNQKNQASINVIRRFIKYLKRRIDLQKKEMDNYVCTFCKNLEIYCGGDHADEMRELAREAWSGYSW